METPDPPIIVLRPGDDAVSAFFTIEEAVDHLGDDSKCTKHGLSGNLADADFFDSRARRLEAVIGPDGGLADLRVESEDRHADHVRERVRHRSQAVRQRVDDERDTFDHFDESPLTLADERITFEGFASELAGILSRNTREPTKYSGHVAGWWHNTFGH